MSGMKTVALLGATGLVGREMLKILEERDYPVSKLLLLASPRSAGTEIIFKGEKITVQAVAEDSFKNIDIALFSAGGTTSRKWAPVAADSGSVVVDNSSAWRMDPAVPLIVPEVNPEAASQHKGIIANPNCSTIQAVVALWPLHKVAGLEYINVSTYQSVSGTGIKATEALKRGSEAVLQGGIPEDDGVYPHPIAFNLLPQIGSFDADGISEEEWKMVNESRKIMDLPDLRVSGTTVRVPVFRCHGESIIAKFKKELTPEMAREALRTAPGVAVSDEPAKGVYPMPSTGTGRDAVFVGRVRKDTGLDNALSMWVVSDNLRKGAALNTVQIAELL